MRFRSLRFRRRLLRFELHDFPGGFLRRRLDARFRFLAPGHVSLPYSTIAWLLVPGTVVFPYFFFSALCGLRLPIPPLSPPAPGSIPALISGGLLQAMAAFTARLSSSGEVALTPVPPNA